MVALVARPGPSRKDRYGADDSPGGLRRPGAGGDRSSGEYPGGAGRGPWADPRRGRQCRGSGAAMDELGDGRLRRARR